jgi:hypothetical protein
MNNMIYSIFGVDKKMAKGPDFLKPTKDTLAKRAGQICSNPDCRKRTSLPHTDENKAVNIGQAAHIRAARKGKARYDQNMTDEDRRAISNGIWLCTECAGMIDRDEAKYPVELLIKWKKEHEKWISDGKPDKDRKIGKFRIIIGLILVNALILVIANIVTFIRTLFEVTKLPPQISKYIPYILFSWGVIASLIGGAIWGLIWKNLGDKNEPHGLKSLLWAIITNLATILSFLYVGKTFLQIDIIKLTIISVAFLIGASVGAWIFYSVPFRSNGIRNFFEQREREKRIKNWLYWNEFRLALIWSSLIAFPAFLLVQLAKIYIYGYAFVPQLLIFLHQLLLVILFTCGVVWSFISIYPSVRKHAMARGLIAGITLRTTLFLGLFIGLYK